MATKMNLAELNKRLAANSFLNGVEIGREDVEVFEGLDYEPQEVNLARWYRAVSVLTPYERSKKRSNTTSFGGAAAGASAGEESEAQRARKQRKQEEKAAKAAAKAAKAAKKQDQVQQWTKKAPKSIDVATKRDKEEAAFVNTTPQGDLKSFGEEMAAKYNPRAVESAWDAWWEKAGFYKPDESKLANGKFVMVIPPPNVTGSLHLGHALTLSIEDALTRWHRMNQRSVVWIPGCDHAGIATQVVVEKQIMKAESKTRWDYGREKFVEKVWEWKGEYGDRIYTQIRRLGASVDWDRAAFTMDETRSRAVTEGFVQMFENGVIYRGTRLNNWCSALRTAISDIEVDYLELEGRKNIKVPGHDGEYPFGVLTNFAYIVEGGKDELVVATTRPETMLGDTGVAVHPDDKRYKHLHGKFVIHPFNGRKIPIICDSELVDMDFGTGAVKITPAHDPNDFLCGKRHGLEEINIFSNEGKVNKQGAPYEGMMRFDCRLKLVEDLKAKGLFRGESDNKMSVPVCSRSGDVIEPRLIPQWWVKCDKMASDAVNAVRQGDLKIIPSDHEATWYRWLENIQDWCISRQLWWGHRIPAYKIVINGKETSDDDMDSWVVGRNEKEAMKKALKKNPGVKESNIKLEQDPDVLDTWFSSGLFPFSTLGWPEKTVDLKNFFPGELLETGHDILFFWVARMVMMSQHLTGQLPFKEVYLHAMVRDKYGRKMSKSLGNVIDPLEVVDGCELEKLHEKLQKGNLPKAEIKKAMDGQKADFPQGIPVCGADALRFGLLSYTMQGQDINLDICRIVADRNFCNKLWNATHLMRHSFDDLDKKVEWNTADKGFLVSTGKKGSLMDKWILSRLQAAAAEINRSFEQYVFGEGCQAARQFLLDELCGVYLESIKPVIRSDDKKAKDIVRKVLYVCFDSILKLMHPYMPFLTEELWHRLPGMANSNQSIMTQQYPLLPVELRNEQVESLVADMNLILHAIRSQKTTHKIFSKKPDVFVLARDAKTAKNIEQSTTTLQSLGGVSSVTIGGDSSSFPAKCAVTVINRSLECHVALAGLVDTGKEAAKLRKQRDFKQNGLTKLEKMMGTPGYLDKAPKDKVEQDKQKAENYRAEIAELERLLAQFE